MTPRSSVVPWLVGRDEWSEETNWTKVGGFLSRWRTEPTSFTFCESCGGELCKLVLCPGVSACLLSAVVGPVRSALPIPLGSTIAVVCFYCIHFIDWSIVCGIYMLCSVVWYK